MSVSTSCSQLLELIRSGGTWPPDAVRRLGEERPDEFFRVLIEGLSDSFDLAQVQAYEDLMRAWTGDPLQATPTIPDRVRTVYVLSRVTLGADIKITGAILDAMKRRFPRADIVFVANRKCAELFAADERISVLHADYPRAGPMSSRVRFACDLRRRLGTPHRIVVDPDSRITQLGLVPAAEPERTFHFPSRTANSAPNLSQLVEHWLAATFGVTGAAYLSPKPVSINDERPRAALSLGVGGNDAKRSSAEFERSLLEALAERFRTVWIDRGAGGEEAARVVAAAEGVKGVRLWEGSFAGFASIISQCDFYAGYDSAGQHAAAACGVPLLTFFNGAPNERFRERWSPYGPGRVRVIMSGTWTRNNLRSILAESSG